MMPSPTLLVSTWSDGLVIFDGENMRHELAGQRVQGLVARDDGSVLAIVAQRTLRRRDRDGGWSELATGEVSLTCCLIAGDDVFVGTEDGAHVLRLEGGALRRCEGFEATPGRERWVAGGMLVDGTWRGPPLGIRSMSAACDGSVMVANVHVGGIPRSADHGASWQPTIEIDADVHQVACHPSRPDIVVAAAAAGLCISRAGGITWQVETAGLHAPYCAAVAFVGDDILVSASNGHFDQESAVYRRAIDRLGRLTLVGGGLPSRVVGIVDTECIGVRGRSATIVDAGGNVHASEDEGRTWARRAQVSAAPSGAVFLPDAP